MLQTIKEFLCSIITSLALFYGAIKFLKHNIKYRKAKFILIVLLYSLYMTIAFNIAINYGNIIRIFANYILLIFCVRSLVNDRGTKVILHSFISAATMFFSEFLCMVLLVYILKMDLMTLKNTFFGSFTTNITIAVISILLLNITKIKDIYNKLFDEIYIKRNKSIIFIVLITFLTFVILVYSLYFDVSTKYSLLLNFILIITFALLALNSVHETNVNAKLKNDYEIVINDLNDYERMLKEKRKLLHNKENDLISIRGLIKGSNKEALEYIDEALNDNYTDDINVLNSVKYIPSGGLQGLIHKKVLKMQNNKIKVILNINKNIKRIKVFGKDGTNNKTICTVVGILLDNAYEAALSSKEKIVNIQLYKETSNFIIKIENSYGSNVDMSKIDESGYSTKGKGRGFGLEFVKEELTRNKWITNERIITSNIFTQIIKIKISN